MVQYHRRSRACQKKRRQRGIRLSLIHIFAEFINAFDRDSTGIDYTIPVDLKYVSGKYHIDLKKDTKKLTGSEALQLIQFYRTENNEYSACLLYTSMERGNKQPTFMKTVECVSGKYDISAAKVKSCVADLISQGYIIQTREDVYKRQRQW